MASPKGGGLGLLIALAISILAALSFAGALFFQQSQVDAEKKKAADAEATAQQAKHEVVEKAQEVNRLNTIIHSSTSAVDMALVQTGILQAAQDSVAQLLNNEKWFDEDAAKKLQLKDGGKVSARKYTNLMEMYPDLIACLDAATSQLNLLRLAKSDALAQVQVERDSHAKTKTEYEAKIAELNKSLNDVKEEKLVVEKNAAQEQKRLQDAVEAALADKTKVQDDAAAADARLRSKISELESRIQEQSEKKKKTLADTEPDGEVVFADQKVGLAWINIGTADHLRRGTDFQVFQYVKGGARKVKGHVEVKQFDPKDDHMAQVAILDETDSADPIVKGDLITSPIFDKRKSMHFVFVGDNKLTNARYGMEELTRRIEEAGGKVDKQVTIDTDYVIATENAEQTEEFTKAVQFGVVIMREDDLLEYLGK